MKKRYLPVFLPGAFLLLVLSAFSLHAPTELTMFFADTLTPPRAKNHLSKNILSSSGVVSFSSGLDNDFYYADSLNRTGYLYVEARLAKFTNDSARRVPLNLSIVIDRSGSMQGIKLGYAKKAAKEIVNRLQPNDFVSIVMYDQAVDSVQPPVPAVNKVLIYARIDGITPRGSTNLWGGTEKGYEYVQKNFKEGLVNRVLLISDGLANVGLTDSNLIKLKVQHYKDDKGITISTFGVGLEYNERLMMEMAERGAGNYYYIDAPDKMTSIFNKELNGLLHVAAQDAVMKISLPKGIKIIKAYPLAFAEQGDTLTLKFRDLFSGDTKGMLFQFSIDRGIKVPLNFTCTLGYTDITDGRKKSLVNEMKLLPVKTRDDYLTHFNKDVMGQAVLYTANENLERAMALVDKGDYDGAARLMNVNKAYLQANAFYARDYDYLQKMDSVNNRYADKVLLAGKMAVDSLRKVQKTERAASYGVRNKKQ